MTAMNCKWGDGNESEYLNVRVNVQTAENHTRATSEQNFGMGDMNEYPEKEGFDKSNKEARGIQVVKSSARQDQIPKPKQALQATYHYRSTPSTNNSNSKLMLERQTIYGGLQTKINGLKCALRAGAKVLVDRGSDSCTGNVRAAWSRCGYNKCSGEKSIYYTVGSLLPAASLGNKMKDPQKQMKRIGCETYRFVRWSGWHLQIGRDANQS
ncbi:uncharacterized protein EDB91DRAFT_1084944 [Suillus paluster]|uniref:uncharacterized protein n=1 Tax=Suillus paluster TaxID=48578 RepID=UPI001B884316|nr:uncharacterized protein EDB91DRAFT_1084944 [Suillus paluster]KAG1731854.1 hypothetical protein EDB91DRAFT_1084944 [Suillus paluster]